MVTSLKNLISDFAKKLSNLSRADNSKFLIYFNKLLSNLDKTFSEVFLTEQIELLREIDIGTVNQSFNLSHGVKRDKNKITLGDWLFDLPQMTKYYTFIIIAVKESLISQVYPDLTINLLEIEEVIINIITILICARIFDITAIETPLIATFRGSFYNPEIDGKDFHYWDNLMQLLFTRKINYEDILEKYKELTIDNPKSYTETDLVKTFSDWVYEKTIRVEETVAPVYLPERFIKIIQLLNKLGYSKGTTGNIGKKLGLHENTIRKQILFLTENYSSYWTANVNWEKLNLHNYFLRIHFNDEETYQRIYDSLLKIPYIRTLYTHRYSDKPTIYTPHIYSPHVIIDGLEAQLRSLLNKGLVDSFTMQLIRDRKNYVTITHYPFKYTKKQFSDMLKGNYNEYLHKYYFTHDKKEFSVVIKDEETLDYNLLFFLGIYRNNYLFKSRMGVIITELPKLYERNNIEMTDIRKQTDFLNQIERRARRRGLLSYNFYIRTPVRRGSDILIAEILDIDQYENGLLERVLEQLRIFSFMGHLTLHDRYIITFSGLNPNHYLKDLIKDILEKAGLNYEFYTIGLAQSRFIPLHELYDFDNNKWLISFSE